MGMAERTRISQRMHQHIIMLLFSVTRISELLKELSYRVSMFIARQHPFVKLFFCKKSFC